MGSTVSLKSQPLHNFSLPQLKWAKNHTNTHRFRKLSDSTQKSPPYDSAAFRFTKDPEEKSSVPDFVEKKSTESDGKTKILLRFRTKKKTDDDVVVVAGDTGDQTSIAAAAAADDVEDLEAKTWNLRPRKKLIIKKSIHHNTNEEGALKSKGPSLQVIKTQPTQTTEKVAEKKKRRFSIELTKEEIELDILAMTGSKPTRRPKKRPKHIQRQLDNVFPGLWLDSITPDSYKVSDDL